MEEHFVVLNFLCRNELAFDPLSPLNSANFQQRSMFRVTPKRSGSASTPMQFSSLTVRNTHSHRVSERDFNFNCSRCLFSGPMADEQFQDGQERKHSTIGCVFPLHGALQLPRAGAPQRSIVREAHSISLLGDRNSTFGNSWTFKISLLWPGAQTNVDTKIRGPQRPSFVLRTPKRNLCQGITELSSELHQKQVADRTSRRR